MDAERAFDIVVFGATGFTGRLVAEYLARNATHEVRWALAGRNRERLQAVKQLVEDIEPAHSGIGLIEADIRDRASLVSMANQARVVLTTVGPYIRDGDKLVRACISAGADYVDITGEPEFVSRTIAEHDASARESGVRIVHCCGFDSIPCDLGVLYTVNHLPEGEPIAIDAFMEFRARFSGGTWHSAIEAMSRWRDRQRARPDAEKRTPQEGGRRVRTVRPRFHYERQLNGWAYRLPTIDPWIVRKSAEQLDRYGPDFRYTHHGLTRSLSWLARQAAGVGLMIALAQFGPTRRHLLERHPSGAGPSPEVRERSWFKATFIGHSSEKSVVTCVSGGDPGYTETSKMVAESALCLAFDDGLPERAGVLTPAVAMGETLIERLHQRGLRFDLLEQ